MWAPFMKKHNDAPTEPVTRRAIGVMLYMGYYVEFPKPIDVKVPDTIIHYVNDTMSQIYSMCNIENTQDELHEGQVITKTLSIGKYQLPEYIVEDTKRPEYVSMPAFANVLASFANHYKWKTVRIDMSPQDKLFYRYDEVIFVYDREVVRPYVERYNEIHHVDGGNEL